MLLCRRRRLGLLSLYIPMRLLGVVLFPRSARLRPLCSRSILVRPLPSPHPLCLFLRRAFLCLVSRPWLSRHFVLGAIARLSVVRVIGRWEESLTRNGRLLEQRLSRSRCLHARRCGCRRVVERWRGRWCGRRRWRWRVGSCRRSRADVGGRRGLPLLGGRWRGNWTFSAPMGGVIYS